jgi:hypothetical protein
MKRFFFLCVFMIGTAVASFGQNTFYFAHVVNGNAGGVWKTTIFLTNPAAVNTQTASGSITLTAAASTTLAAGTPMNINFVDANGLAVSGPVIPFQIAGGQTIKLTSTGGATFTGGFATVTSNFPVSGTAVFSFFNDSTGTNLFAEAGVPSAAAVARQSIFVDVGSGFDVGVAYANPGATAAPLTLTLLNANAQTVMTTTQTLGAGNHVAGFVSQLFGLTSIQPMTGTLQITSTSGALAAVALRFAPSGVFTTLPPVTIASILTTTRNAFAFILQTLHAHVA